MILHLCGFVISCAPAKRDPTPNDGTERAGLGELGNDVALCYIVPNDDGWMRSEGRLKRRASHVHTGARGVRGACSILSAGWLMLLNGSRCILSLPALPPSITLHHSSTGMVQQGATTHHKTQCKHWASTGHRTGVWQEGLQYLLKSCMEIGTAGILQCSTVIYRDVGRIKNISACHGLSV